MASPAMEITTGFENSQLERIKDPWSEVMAGILRTEDVIVSGPRSL